jgi:hypothetical protein
MVKHILHWFIAITHENYCIHYWEQVAINEWWLSMMMEITKEKKDV